MNKKNAILATLAILVIGWGVNMYYHREPVLPETTPLRLEVTDQNIYLYTSGMVSLLVRFEKEVDDFEKLKDKVSAIEGVRRIYPVGRSGHVFKVTFDPGRTLYTQLLANICEVGDDPSLF